MIYYIFNNSRNFLTGYKELKIYYLRKGTDKLKIHPV